MERRERYIFKTYLANRAPGQVIVDGPRLSDTKTLVREDTPFYMAAAFVKIFQTGEGDYWAYAKQRKAAKLEVNLHQWLQHVLKQRDGRALRHPRFFYFAVNTLLRNKAVRSKGFFVKQAFGEAAYEEKYTPREMLDMGKKEMCNVVCAYEGHLPGSAAEKLRQRNDLEAMLNTLEEESCRKARDLMPRHQQALREKLEEAKAWLQAQSGLRTSGARGSAGACR